MSTMRTVTTAVGNSSNYPPTVRHKLRPTARAWRVELAQRKPRQEICAPLKWLCFILNFFGFLVGVTSLALGIYLCTKEPRPIGEVADVLLNPAVLLPTFGLTVCAVSLCGLFGALRDNVCLLKTYALCIFFSYALLVGATFILFMLFYTESAEGISAQSVLLHAIRKYHSNKNVADFVDYLQEQLECCGSAASGGYHDWELSEQFKCNQSNANPERCGVPFSCCRRSVVSGAAGSHDSLVGSIRSIQCWQNVQLKREQDLEQDIYLRGCLHPLKALFERYAIQLGAFVALAIVPVSIGVCLSQCLARQIDYQRYLLEREERKVERRVRRERRYREQVVSRKRSDQHPRQGGLSVGAIEIQVTTPSTQQQGTAIQNHQQHRTGDARAKRPLPAPQSTAELETAALAVAMEASRRQWKLEERERKRRRIKSQSPMGDRREEPRLDPHGAANTAAGKSHGPPGGESVQEKIKERRQTRGRREGQPALPGTQPAGTANYHATGSTSKMWKMPLKPLILKQSDFQ